LVNAFITHYFPQGSRSKIFDYVRDLKFGDKPGSMQLHRLVSRLKTIRRLAMLIPDATNLRMAEHELTKKVYELSPPNQRDNVKRKFNDDITGTSLADMERALETEIEIAHAKKQRNGNHKHQRNNGDRVQSNQATTQHDQEDGNNSNHNSNIQGGWGPNTKCRKHPLGNHTWINCILNPNGPNYSPQAAQRAAHNNNAPQGQGQQQHQQQSSGRWNSGGNAHHDNGYTGPPNTSSSSGAFQYQQAPPQLLQPTAQSIGFETYSYQPLSRPAGPPLSGGWTNPTQPFPFESWNAAQGAS